MNANQEAAKDQQTEAVRQLADAAKEVLSGVESIKGVRSAVVHAGGVAPFETVRYQDLAAEAQKFLTYVKDHWPQV